MEKCKICGRFRQEPDSKNWVEGGDCHILCAVDAYVQLETAARAACEAWSAIFYRGALEFGECMAKLRDALPAQEVKNNVKP